MVARRSVFIGVAVTFAACLRIWSDAVWSSSADKLALVTLRASVPTTVAAQLIESAGGRILEQLRPLLVYRVALPGDDAERILQALRANSAVRAAEYEGEQVSQITPNDALYQAYQWNLRRIGMEQAWDLRPSAADIMVAVLDTGVDLNHPDLRANLLVDQGYDFLNDLPTPQDDESHGTAVAGIIRAVGDNHDGVGALA